MNIINLNTYFTQTIPEIIHKMGTCNFSIGSSHLVQITHINNPHSFYARISCLRYAIKLLESRGEPINASDLTLGKLVVYKSKTVNRFVRGRVQKFDLCEIGLGMVCAIFAIDYGFADTHVLLKHVFLPKDESLMCGPLALHCQLTTCESLDDQFDEEAVRAMKFFVGRYTAKIIIRFKTTEKLKVELRTVECREDVSTMLALLHFTSFFRVPRRAYIPPSVYRYRHRELSAGDKLHVRVQNGCTIFGVYVAEIEEYKNYDNVIEWYKFTKYCMEQPALDVVAAAMDGRSCGVKVLNPVRYERAIVLQITVPNAKALVQLVDWGKEIEANFEDLKPVTDVFIQRPIMGLFCSADRLQCLTYGLGLRMIYPGLEFLLEVLEPGIGFRIPHRVNLHPLFPTPANNPLTDDESEEEGAEE